MSVAEEVSSHPHFSGAAIFPDPPPLSSFRLQNAACLDFEEIPYLPASLHGAYHGLSVSAEHTELCHSCVGCFLKNLANKRAAQHFVLQHLQVESTCGRGSIATEPCYNSWHGTLACKPSLLQCGQCFIAKLLCINNTVEVQYSNAVLFC